MLEKSDCDIIIPVYNSLELTKNCLDSIFSNTSISFNIILVDNNSDEATGKYLEMLKSSHKNVFLIRNENNLGWVKAVNQGMRISVSPYICIMNNDTVVRTNGWLSGLIGLSGMADDIGLVNPRFETKESVNCDEPFIEVDFCRGYCILIKRAVMDKIGVLDEAYGLGYYDDDDYSVRAIRAGYRCVRANSVFVEHVRDSTFSALFGNEKRRELHDKNKKLFYSRWGKRLKVVFVITHKHDIGTISRLLFGIARKQHIIYVWNFWQRLGLKHINIRERTFSGFFHKFIMYLLLILNRTKKAPKRYSVILTDGYKMAAFLRMLGSNACYVDMDKGMEGIESDIDRLSGVQDEM